MDPFVATEPYVIKVMGVDNTVRLYGASRTYDFSGQAPFINPKSGVADPGVIQGWDARTGSSRNLLGYQMTNDGLPGRVEKHSGTTMVRYNAGDGITAGKCRTQVVGYAIPPRTRVRWEFNVAFGANDRQNSWVLTTPRESPVLFWETKSISGTNPSMSAVVDTDPGDPGNSLKISFYKKGGKATTISTVASVGGLPRHTLIPIVVEAFLDEREISEGGIGREQVWVDGKLVADVAGPTLTWGPGEHQWVIAMYLYNEPRPYRYTRASFWETARMFVYPAR